MRAVSQSRLFKKGHFVSIRWIEGTNGIFHYCISISAKIISRASTRNRLKRVITEWLNQQGLRLRPGVIMFVRLSRAGSEDEILDDLKGVVKNNFYG